MGNGKTRIRTDGWTDGQMSGLTDGRMSGRTDERVKHGYESKTRMTG